MMISSRRILNITLTHPVLGLSCVLFYPFRQPGGATVWGSVVKSLLLVAVIVINITTVGYAEEPSATDHPVVSGDQILNIPVAPSNTGEVRQQNQPVQLTVPARRLPDPPVLAKPKKKWWWPFGEKQPPPPPIEKHVEVGPRTIPAQPDPLLRLPSGIRLPNGQRVSPGIYLVKTLGGDDERRQIMLYREGQIAMKAVLARLEGQSRGPVEAIDPETVPAVPVIHVYAVLQNNNRNLRFLLVDNGVTFGSRSFIVGF
ncbi:MAG: hypothetical protein KTR14_09100 [Vampirovibrio sp.]|nr:hypothetical protein [Vampirovibrio sp.]